MVRLETKTKAADVKFLKCTSTGVEVERKDKKAGVISFSRIWKITKAAPTVVKKSPTKPVAERPPESAPVVEAKPAVEPPPVREIEYETEPKTGGAFVLDNVKVFWGMGVALGVSDPYSARRRSDRRARTEIFKLFKRNLDIFAGMAPEDAQAKMEAFEKAAVKETMIVDRWLNHEEDSCTSVAVLPVAECGLDPREANILWNRISRGRSESR